MSPPVVEKNASAGHIVWRAANTFGEVLRVVEVDFAKAAVSLHKVILGATQVDLTVLGTKHTKRNGNL